MKSNLLKLGAALLCAAITTAHAGVHTWTGGNPITSNWSAIANWAGNNPPGTGERDVTVIFPSNSQNYESAQDIVGLQIGEMQILGNYTFHVAAGAAYTFYGTNDVVLVGASSTFDDDATLHVTGKPDFVMSNSATLTIRGPIQGAGGLNKRGPGTLRLEGISANTFSGETYVWEGALQLAKSSGVGISGPLVIGDYVGGVKADKVVLYGANQISDSSQVTVHSSGLLDLNNYNETLGSLNFIGGQVAMGTGTLTLAGPVAASESLDAAINDGALIKGKINLGSVAKSFQVSGKASLDLIAAVSGSAPVVKSGSGALLLSSSNSFSGNLTIQEGSVLVFDPYALGTTAGQTYVLSGATLDLGYSSVVSGETMHLNGMGQNSLGALSAHNGFFNPTFIGSLVLDSDASIFVATNLILSIKGVISGPGGYHKLGDGELWLDGGAANSYAGTTYVDAGRLTLGKSANVVAVPGNLVVGDNSGWYETDSVVLQNNGQLAVANVTVRSTGLLDIGANTQTIGNLTMDGSAHLTVDNSGVLNLPTLITFTGLNPVPSDPQDPGLAITASIGGDGEAHLLNSTTVNATWVSHFGLRLTGGASAHIIKTGEGSFSLSASNSYAGLTLIKAGVLDAYHPYALGSTTSGTIVTNSGALSIVHASIAGEALTLASDNNNQLGCTFSGSTTSIWSGPITLLSNSVIKAYAYNNSGLFRLSGAIGGPGKLIKTGPAYLELAGAAANTYAGGTYVNEGALLLNKSGVLAVPGALTVGDGTNSTAADEVRLLGVEQIADNSVVEVKAFGLLNLNSFSETIGSLQGAGVVSTVLGTLTAGGNNFTTTFSGLIGGVGITSFVKQGNGTMLFTGTNSASGRTIVRGGKLYAHGQFTGPILVTNNATLGGNGSVANVFATNGVVSPGAGPGLLDTKNLVLDAGSVLRLELNGTNAGINCDQVNVIGSVALGNSTLNATLGFGSALSNQFVLIKNDGAEPVSGTFAGLPEGATTSLGGATFKITYAGGDGNDVVLTQITSVPQPAVSTIQRLPGGQIQMTGQGLPGTTYTVLANTNLSTTNWIAIGTAMASPVNGTMQFTDSDAASFPIRFYRFLMP